VTSQTDADKLHPTLEAFIAMNSYERGHSSGMGEVAMIAEGLRYDLAAVNELITTQAARIAELEAGPKVAKSPAASVPVRAVLTRSPVDDGGPVEYRSEDGYVVRREQGTTPNGNPIANRWVLRSPDGEWLDFDQFRSDLAERNGIKLASSEGE
jgi:hypothetical protein